MTIAIIAGARPNFIKAAPLYRALRAQAGVDIRLIHTGQHQSTDMSEVFFQELGLPEPWVRLEGRSQSTVQETARIMVGLEPPLEQLQPDWAVVIGDITSTLAGTMAAKQLGLRVAHVEAGLRSNDRSMPEELNRIVVDHLADLLFASEEAGMENLNREGIPPGRVHFTGNILIDALESTLPAARKLNPVSITGRLDNSVLPDAFALFTFHRPSNVDEPAGLLTMINLIEHVATRLPIVFPLHPRTASRLKQFQFAKKIEDNPAVRIISPLNYSAMVCLMQNAAVVVTDSGGVQEETTCLGTPCLTFRNTTERPATINLGTNTLIQDRSPDSVMQQIELILSGKYKSGQIPPLWDGRAAERIAAILLRESFHQKNSPVGDGRHV